MTVYRLLLSGLLAVLTAIGASGASAQISLLTDGHLDRFEHETVLSNGHFNETSLETPRAQESQHECSASLMALLPTSEDLDQVAGYTTGELTGRGCRTLTEVAETFEDPEQAALDLSAWGWVDTVYETTSNGSRYLRISVQRFRTPEGAAQALDAFGSLANEPAGTTASDRSQLQPNQRALGAREWSALIEQDGVLVTRISILCRCDAPGPLLSETLAIMEAMRGAWSSRDTSDQSRVTPLTTMSDPDADLELGMECLSSGPLACAKENLDAAFARNTDANTRSALYEFQIVNGDEWQKFENLHRARQAYRTAMRLDPVRREAPNQLARLRGYSEVELFDPFIQFYNPRGCDPHPAMIDVICFGGRVQDAPLSNGTNGQLLLTSTRPGWDTAYWASTPTGANYAITTVLSPVLLSPQQLPGGPEVIGVLAPPPASIGLNLAHTPSDTGITFLLDTGTQEWWVGTRDADGAWTELIPRTSYGGRTQNPVTSLEVQVRDGTPRFLINETEVTEAMDLSWLLIPQTGDVGVVLSASDAPATEPPSAMLESFGIYALNGEGANGGQTESSLLAMLPTQADVPDELILTQEGARQAEEITQTFPDPGDAAQRFAAWGWQENAYRDFASPDGTTSLSVNLHRFGDPQAAAEALPYLADARAVAMGLEPIPVADIGDQVEAVAGHVAGDREVSLYVRQGVMVARVTVIEVTGEPLATAVSVARAMFKD